MIGMNPGVFFGPALGVASVIAIVVGGVMFFVLGKGRGTLAGIAFIVLAAGVLFGSIWPVFLPQIVAAFDLRIATASGMFTVLQLVVDVIGWGLVILAVLRLRNAGPPAPAAAPPPPPHGPYGGQAGPWGPPPPNA